MSRLRGLNGYVRQGTLDELKDVPIVAIACSDLHLSHSPPVARSAEFSWYQAMQRDLMELSDLAQRFGDVPILCAGDVFDRWNSPPQLINWAISMLPDMIAIPGQHDLPNHSIDQLSRSAYMTLAYEGSINNLMTLGINIDKQIQVQGFYWGKDLKMPYGLGAGGLKIALAHKLVWKESLFPRIPDEGNVESVAKQLEGFDIAIFGDNHQGFYHEAENGLKMFNCGTFMRRTIAEKDYQPQVGLIHQDGTITIYRLDVSADRWADWEQLVEQEIPLAIVDHLRRLETSKVDFLAQLKEIINSASELGLSLRAADVLKETWERVR